MYLSSLIREAYRKNGVVVAYVYGPMGYGKTSYALWTAYEVLGSWDQVLKYLFFDLNDVIRTMWKHVRRKTRIPILILDDAGFWLNRLTWWEKEKIEFMELMNLARSISAGIIFTSPSQEVPRQILNKCNYRVAVKPIEEEEKMSSFALEASKVAESIGLEPHVAVARGFQLITLPSFMKLVKKEFLDYYPLHYPIYEEYTKVRMKYVERKLMAIRERKSESRRQLLEQAVERYLREKDSKKLYKFLVGKLPPSTAHRWAYERIPALVGDPSIKKDGEGAKGDEPAK
ncbi:MAG: hypothetical protein LM558_03345 [Thermosphaera sp.]|nr:hypothetical protein [Thermosphaera sp.]